MISFYRTPLGRDQLRGPRNPMVQGRILCSYYTIQMGRMEGGSVQVCLFGWQCRIQGKYKAVSDTTGEILSDFVLQLSSFSLTDSNCRAMKTPIPVLVLTDMYHCAMTLPFVESDPVATPGNPDMSLPPTNVRPRQRIILVSVWQTLKVLLQGMITGGDIKKDICVEMHRRYLSWNWKRNGNSAETFNWNFVFMKII